MFRIVSLLTFLFAAITLSGCASFGKGITEALLEKQTAEDTRLCEIRGKAFGGLKPKLERQNSKMKVLMVHGVGDHLPGYSTEFLEKLTKELGLTITTRKHKNIALSDPAQTDKQLGNLRIHRYLNEEQSKELLFYELTWSQITADEKQVLAYDNSGEFSFRRAEINDLLKKFSNDTGPDPIIYLGESRDDILTAFTQSFCWMAFGDWSDLPDNAHLACTDMDAGSIVNDNYAIVSHSLGSRITIDGLQRIASTLGSSEQANRYESFVTALKNKEIPIYMMSNQLPMLQLGRKLPEVSGQEQDYCQAPGVKYAERMLQRTPIIAFSDPNDLLSYAIPHDFVRTYLDSRLCIDVTNININVATVYDIFGLGKMANPMDAHIGYDTDDRVIALIARGTDADVVGQDRRCSWVKTID